MAPTVLALPTTEALIRQVKAILCERDSLDPLQTPLFRTPLMRRGEVCGYVFHIEGPRRLKNSAIWAIDADKIIFYDSTGTRFHEVRLSESPSLNDAA